MTDIVEDLRDQAWRSSPGPMMSAVRETPEWQAADEIESLRVTIEGWRDEQAKAEARIAELEGALKVERAKINTWLESLELRITKPGWAGTKSEGYTCVAVPEWALRQALERIGQALATKPQEAEAESRSTTCKECGQVFDRDQVGQVMCNPCMEKQPWYGQASSETPGDKP